MKRLFLLCAGICLASALFSCGGKIDTSGWITSLDDAKKAASKENKKIFLFFSEDEGDKRSVKLKNNLFNTKEFIDTYTEKYVLVNLDYSESRFDNNHEGLQKDMRIYRSYDVPGTPHFLILSPEGYVISKLAFDEGADIDTARITFSEAEETVKEFDELLEKTKKGTKEEKLAAINEIVDKTDEQVLLHLAPLNKLYLSLDKKNQTESYTKHLFLYTNAKACEQFFDNEPEKASEEFVKLSKNTILKAEEKQEALYTAGYLLSLGGSEDLRKILSYFQEAYDIAPESEAAQVLKQYITQIKMLIDGEGDGVTNEK